MTPPPEARLFRQLLEHPTDQGYRPFRSGNELALALGISRTAVWKHVAALREAGVDVEALPRRGYRLGQGVTRLEADDIRAALPDDVAARLRHGDCVWDTQSTNADLLARPAPPAGRFDFLSAECQHAGRGRRGRRWFAPPGGGLCLSWSWTLDALPPQAGTLSLAIGVAALRALRDAGTTGVLIKWPNDLVTVRGKVGGILVEMRSESAGPVVLIVGIGLNLHLPLSLQQVIHAEGNQAASLCAAGDSPLSRSALAASILTHGVRAMDTFRRSGFSDFQREFDAADSLRGRAVVARGGPEDVDGVAVGVDAEGALLVDTAHGRRRLFSGDVSVRAARVVAT
jgi:BirA family biotin operon repressor/biotin-[acetyl-CoA-carboxylase] ligase